MSKDEKDLSKDEEVTDSKVLDISIDEVKKWTTDEKLLYVQSNMKVPKTQVNKFANFNFRSCEDILNAFKPFGKLLRVTVRLQDSIELIGGRFYIKATAIFKNVDDTNKETNTINHDSYAREADKNDKMSEAQTTGSSSSYARKYALNGLFGIDDTKDDDFDMGNKPKGNNKPNNNQSTPPQNNKPVNLVSKEQLAKMKELKVNFNALAGYYKIPSLKEIPNKLTFEQARVAIANKLKQIEKEAKEKAKDVSYEDKLEELIKNLTPPEQEEYRAGLNACAGKEERKQYFEYISEKIG